MIASSVVLVLVAAVLLGLGLVSLDEPLLYSSIGVSGLAAVALVLGVRRLAAVRAGQPLVSARPGGATLGLASAAVRPEPAAFVGRPPRRGAVTGRAAARPIGRATPRPVGRATVRPGLGPPPTEAALDEPAEQPLTETEAAALRSVQAEVVVVDGRPRYHVVDCPRVLGLDSEVVVVAEAHELGFTPCAECRPATALLGERGGG